MLRTTAVVALLGVTGCSFMNVHGPGDQPNPPQVYVGCTDQSMDPFIDLGLGILTAAAVVTALIDKSNGTDPQNKTTASGFILPVIFGGSAVYGFTRISACRDHHLAWARAHPESPNGPVPMAYPPPGYGYPPPGYYPPPPQPQQPQPPPLAAPGGEGASCTAATACATGLVCASELCVRVPDASN